MTIDADGVKRIHDADAEFLLLDVVVVAVDVAELVVAFELVAIAVAYNVDSLATNFGMIDFFCG